MNQRHTHERTLTATDVISAHAQVLYEGGGHSRHRCGAQLRNQFPNGQMLVGQGERRSEQCALAGQSSAQPDRLPVQHGVRPAGSWVLVSAGSRLPSNAGTGCHTAAGPVPARNAGLHVRPVCRIPARIYGVSGFTVRHSEETWNQATN